CSTSPSRASTPSPSGTSRRSWADSRNEVSECSSPTTTCAKRWPSPTAPTSCTTGRSWPLERAASWPTTPEPARSTWARSSRSDAPDRSRLSHAPTTSADPTSRHDAALAAGHPAAAALDSRAGAGRSQGARGESAARGSRPGDPGRRCGGARLAGSSQHGDARRARHPRAPVQGDGLRGRRADELRFDLSSAVFDEPDERTPVSMEEREEMPFENLGRTGTSLDEHLNEQLRLATDDPRTVAIGEAIIGNLDDDGYLRAEV